MDEPQIGEDGTRFCNALLRPIRVEMFAIPALRELKHLSHRLDVATRNPMSSTPLRDVILVLEQQHRAAGVDDIVPSPGHGSIPFA